MSAAPLPKRRGKKATAFTPEEARESILAKLRKAGAKGVPSFFTAKTDAAKRGVIEHVLVQLEAERAVIADRTKAKPKFYLREFAPALPSLESVCARIEATAAEKHPQLLTAAELKRALPKPEQALFEQARYWLEAQRLLIKLRRGKSDVFGHAGLLRAALGDAEGASFSTPEKAAAMLDAGAIRETYRTLAQRSGFPAIEIAALQRATEIPLADLHRWLAAEYRAGRAVFSFGDWSLADAATRAAALELDGERYLLVRLQP